MEDLNYKADFSEDWDDDEDEEEDCITRLKVIRVNAESILFEYGIELSSYHESDCCESHYLSFADLSLDDFDGLEFDLSDDTFFNRIDGYGIELIPIKGFTVKVPGYGSNNGYYSSNLDLIITDNKAINRTFDISECQDIGE